MRGGYMGFILFVDLNAGTITKQKLDEKIYRDFVGNVGLGVRILHEHIPPKADPLGPNNMLGFVTGPLTGTSVPSTSRYTVVAKSPLTGTWGDANSGGSFGPEMKAAGYDAVFFKGISNKPIYLLIEDGKAELKDASHLWGKDTFEVEEILRSELKDKATQVACIGPSGELVSLLAAVIHDKGRAAARSGVGAVMGAKRIKAIAVRGSKKVPVADTIGLASLKRDQIKQQIGHPWIKSHKDYGTPVGLVQSVITGDAPIKNWNLMGQDSMPGFLKLSAEELNKYKLKKYTCRGCPIACGAIVKVMGGPYAIEKGHRPEYETLVSFGTMCFNDNLESIIKANEICNRFGIDTMSVGATIAFAMECYERGIINKEQTGGIELTWGNADGLIAILQNIALREGFGAVLADGVKRAAERIGHGSEQFAIHVHGQEVPYHDPRLYPAAGTSYIADPTPARHTAAATGMVCADLSQNAGGPYPTLQVTSVADDDYQQKGLIYALGSDYYHVFTASGFCEFPLFVAKTPFVEYMSSVTGWNFTLEEALSVGRRIQTLRQIFNVREGIQAENFSLPHRIKIAPSIGPLEGKTVDFTSLRSAYFQALGWDSKTGKPLEETVTQLGLKDLVNL